MWHLLPPLLDGMKTTLLVTLYSIAVALVLAFAAGFGRLSKSRTVRGVTLVYVEVFRGTSLLVQLFWMYFALPLLLDVRIPAMSAAVLALGLNYGAYGSEVVRSCVLAVPKGQTEAAIALNLTPRQRMRRIILPQAWRMMLPAFGNLQIELLKGTSLVYLITLSDVTFRGMVLRSSNMTETPAIFGWILILFFIVAFALTRLIRFFERRAAVGRG
ncbi:ectoine/hydroxyectoine ABC transporter permease subunit EhuC [Cohnella zeiphila]|uniref:Ectoine/hydroxyectoine ABC transporter permease subunit EhuC n=1 Tax=Cohnella zeiphila TaxID=2761120 RepID=A0A7X0VV95_9BACL|nr:ectoine/hydroxyectoine ABC transporter permease subunit EhuC [Cohnella zeiphila]MBB6731736.1 ectoine/hydroxyectoine ABC transporter permease subunit EhuC [Cohnella zeiphila]